ncbi:MAG: 3-oxoacyl-[acyl-carrier-protein] reductase [Alkalispirochaetaceae bacterium]
MLLEGRKALVTGGSRGIGREIVRTFLRNGADVFYISRSPGDSLEEFSSIAEEEGRRIVYKEGNVGDEETISRVIEEVLEESGGLDVLVNNAGITRDGLVFRMNAEDWAEVLNINLTSAFYICKIVARHMIKRRVGSIINVTSIVGIIGNAGQTNYSAAKAGLIGFTKSLAREVAGRNVRVNAIAPGYIETDMTERLTDEQRDSLIRQIPMGRVGTPEEVAKGCLFLGSELSSYVTGQVLHTTGGLGM